MQIHWDNPEYCKQLSDSQKKSNAEDPDYKEKRSLRMKETFNNPERKAKNAAHITAVNTSREKREFMAKVKGGKPFMCMETGERFDLLQDAADRFGVDKRAIHKVLKYPLRNKTILRKYTFKYIE